MATTGKRVVLLVENESVPTDRRVWNEARMLHDAGYQVTVVCPTGDGRDHETTLRLDGVDIRRFPLRRASGGVSGFLVEYLTALVRIAWIVWRLPGRIDVIHTANPPDFISFIGLVPKLRWGTKIIFDHHDLVPELFQARFGAGGPALRLVQAVERLNLGLADAVISTNESYRQIAIERGHKRPDQVRVVRNARDLTAFRRVQPDDTLRNGRPHMAVYVGVMGPQDGADVAVRVAGHYRNALGRDDVQFVFVGDGDALATCRRLADELGVADMVTFAGWVDFDDVLRYLSSADVGLATDPPSPLNNHSTMIKVIEYMAIGLPVVSYDLPESVVTAGDAALYAPGGDELELARNLAKLIDDPGLRDEMGERALGRNQGLLSWETARTELLATYRSVLGDVAETGSR